ncbi:MAG TPA: ATP-binding protein [Victivallales bacterium]|nr:ATP-binding protein [Victivallales bacterium]
MDEFEVRETLNKESRIKPKWFIISYILITIFFLCMIPVVNITNIYITKDLYISIKITGSLLACIAAIACIVYYLGSNNRYYLIVALGFFISSSEDFTHGLLIFIKIFANKGITLYNFIYFISGTYVAGRSVLAILIITAILFEHIVQKSSVTIKIESVVYSLLTVTIGAVATIIAFGLQLPDIIFPNEIISRPMDFISAILFFIAFLLVAKRFYHYRDIFSGTLLACILINIFAQLFIAFSTELFDINFDIANSAAVLSYCIPILGIICETLKKGQIAEFEIAERIEAESKIKRMNEELEDAVNKRTADLQLSLSNLEKAQIQLIQSEKMSSLGILAAGVAHEINNPISYVKSNFEVIEDYRNTFESIFKKYDNLINVVNTNNMELIQDVFDSLKKSIREEDLNYILSDFEQIIQESKDGLLRIIDIVNSLRYFAHEGSSQLRDVNINKELQTTLKLAWNELKYKCKVTKKLGDIPILKGYPGELNQVFLNLIVNAAQAIREHGEIIIETKSDSEFVTINFTDTGIGISQENISKLFDPFFTTKEIGTGTGLGLSISLGIVKKHNGTINVESEPDIGTTFSIKLPIGGINDNS